MSQCSDITTNSSIRPPFFDSAIYKALAEMTTQNQDKSLINLKIIVLNYERKKSRKDIKLQNKYIVY